jgi:hypothetical protein
LRFHRFSSRPESWLCGVLRQGRNGDTLSSARWVGPGGGVPDRSQERELARGSHGSPYLRLVPFSVPRYDMTLIGPDFVRAAERLYAECERAIEAGRIGARSPIGDAALDYRDLGEECGLASDRLSSG